MREKNSKLSTDKKFQEFTEEDLSHINGGNRTIQVYGYRVVCQTCGWKLELMNELSAISELINHEKENLHVCDLEII